MKLDLTLVFVTLVFACDPSFRLLVFASFPEIKTVAVPYYFFEKYLN